MRSVFRHSLPLRLQSAIGLVLFVVGFGVLTALEGGDLKEAALIDALWVTSLITAISSALLYTTAIRPFVERAIAAERDLAAALKTREEKARELSAALAQRTAHRMVLDQHAIVSETDLAGQITYVNDRFLATTGYTREELYGQNYRLLNSGVHPQELWRDMYGRMVQGQVWQGEICNKRKDGSLYWVQATNSAIRDNDGRISGFVSVRLDITDTKQREQALKSAQDLLQRERAKAEAASIAKSSFLSTMSHEMRTPLNGVLGALDLLRDSGLDEKQSKLVSIAHESGDALLVHINDVLDFSKMEAGRLDLELHPFDLRRLVNSVLHIVAPQAAQCGNALSSACSGELPAEVVGDRIRVRQVLLNLVSNANKFTRNGRIVVEVTRIGGPADHPEIEVAVSDTGIGIPKERLKDLFQEFSMLDSSFTRKTSGTGLGLAISKRLIEAMAGVIGVESIDGKGSRFWFRFSLPARWTTDDVPDESSPAAPIAVKKLEILLADDNATNQLVASQMLTEAGHDVVTVANGREAVEAASERHFDVILTDISMPEMDGIEATRRIRALAEPYCLVPIVALTANAIAGDRERFLAAGMNAYLTKPIRRAELEGCLASLFADGPPPSKLVREPAGPKSGNEPPVLDSAELQRLAEDATSEVVPLVIEAYIAEMKGRLDEASSALRARDLALLERVTHAIAGASSSTGARRLQDVSKRIELDCSAGKREQALARANELPLLMPETERSLKDYLAKLPA